MATSLEFKRGDNITHFFVMPVSAWTPGGKLFFAAKPSPDDDTTDAAAVINKTFTDADAVTDGLEVTYTLNFVPLDTNKISSGGAAKKEYQGEFQFVSTGGVVTTFPGNSNYIDTVVYFDIRRSIA